MTRPTKPTIDEQILAFKMIMKGYPVDDAILATLERVKQAEAGLPVEPEYAEACEFDNEDSVVSRIEYDALRGHIIRVRAESAQTCRLGCTENCGSCVPTKAAEAGLPVEPEHIKILSTGFEHVKNYNYPEECLACYLESMPTHIMLYLRQHRLTIDSLQSALQRAHTERENWQETARQYAGNSDYWRERAEKAEALNKRMVELMKEPSEAMWSAVWVSIKVPPLQRARSVLSVHDLRLLWAAFHQAMSAELLKEVGE